VILQTAGHADTRRIAELHAGRIDEGYLATLGPAFLRLLYRRAIRSPHAFVLVAVDGERIVGFVAGATDLKRFYRSFLLREGILAAVASAPRLIVSFPRAVETLRYPGTTNELPGAEILAVAVDGACTRRGLGRRLVQAATQEFHERGVPAAKVVAGATNAPALHLYEGCGFVRRDTISVHGDARSEVLVWPSS
jgi:ribosomal protein S18 acetylase RimI-like enzyme